jgi:hypothetical protein
LVRVELPGDALVLEAAFAPLEPLSALRDLVAACLAPAAAAAFYLFTAPPKTRLVRARMPARVGVARAKERAGLSVEWPACVC